MRPQFSTYCQVICIPTFFYFLVALNFSSRDDSDSEMVRWYPGLTEQCVNHLAMGSCYIRRNVLPSFCLQQHGHSISRNNLFILFGGSNILV
jgi:hypothetical protein